MGEGVPGNVLGKFSSLWEKDWVWERDPGLGKGNTVLGKGSCPGNGILVWEKGSWPGERDPVLGKGDNVLGKGTQSREREPVLQSLWC